MFYFRSVKHHAVFIQTYTPFCVISFYGMVICFYGMVISFYGMVISFYGMVISFYGMVISFYGMVISFYAASKATNVLFISGFFLVDYAYCSDTCPSSYYFALLEEHHLTNNTNKQTFTNTRDNTIRFCDHLYTIYDIYNAYPFIIHRINI